MFNTKNSNKKKKKRKILERAKMIYQQTEKLLELYNLYGFECVEQNSDYLVLTYTSGYFSNAEIVLLSDVFSVENIQDQYECLGFSVRVVHFTSLEETHNNLFMGSKISEQLSRLLDENNDLAKSIFRYDRSELLVYLTKIKTKLPLTANNMVFLINHLSVKHPDICKITPAALNNILGECS